MGILRAGGGGRCGPDRGLHAYRIRWQRRILQAEQQQVLANERTRIARDLHDELGTALTGLALELDVLRREDGADAPTRGRLKETASRARMLAERMREVVWAVNPRCDTVPSLVLFLEQQAVPFLRAAGLRCRLDFPEALPGGPLATEVRHQLALGVREALTNIVRHAHAAEVQLGLQVDDQSLSIRISDDGHGFDPSRRSGNGNGHGLDNLRSRLARVGGEFLCESAPGRGTRVEFRVPVARNTVCLTS